MSANTAKGWPYVQPADALADFPVTSQALANKADASVPFAFAQGSGLCAFSAVANSSVVVTLPAGRFTQTPNVLLGVIGSPTATPYAPRVQARSTSSLTLAINTSAAITGNITVAWLAVQATPSAAEG